MARMSKSPKAPKAPKKGETPRSKKPAAAKPSSASSAATNSDAVKSDAGKSDAGKSDAAKVGASKTKPATTKRPKATAIVKDVGPKPQSFMLEEATKANRNYRTVAWTGRYLQLTLMSIPVGGDIGLEAHPQTDQFIRLDAGKGRAQMGPSKDKLTFDQEVEDGWCVLVPAGQWHNITNIGDEPMQVYVIYAPSHHAQGIVQKTKEDAEKDEKAGVDEPPEWTVQPPKHEADKTA